MKKTLSVFIALLALYALVLVAIALTTPSLQVSAASPTPPLPVDAAAAATRFATALRFETVSQGDGPVPAAALQGFREHLRTTYPRMHAALPVEVFAEHSLLFRWEGLEPTLPAAVLLAHQDVVPVDSETTAQWTHPPFAGVIADGFVWGRGAIDFKLGVVGLCEAVETLLERGFRPKRTIYLAFGHDEEIGGKGAQLMAARLEQVARGAFMVLDEGLSRTQGFLPGVERPVALIGIAEKGYMSIELSVHAEGGHSSLPPPHTAVGVLAEAITRLERSPLPASLSGPAEQLFTYVAAHTAWPLRLVYANQTLLAPILIAALEAKPAGNALLRTTTAATMFSGSMKDNVLPTVARAVVNFRIRPGERRDDVVEFVRRVIDDPSVELKPLLQLGGEPSPVSPVDGPAFALLQQTLAASFPDALVAPSLVLGATDARHFTGVSDAIYRFAPFALFPEDRKRIHGIDERLSVDDLVASITFYGRLMEAL